MSKNCAVILAAGEGKRMKANKPKPAGRESASAPVTPS